MNFKFNLSLDDYIFQNQSIFFIKLVNNNEHLNVNGGFYNEKRR
ncbi:MULTISPECIES: hypothetical protein [Bacillaceae]|nr:MULTISPECIES: hypothetical protein [Bacillaceae]SFC84872.1 hypothetical protein SAMN02799633_01912 [Bacillus sp. UNCCL81]